LEIHNKYMQRCLDLAKNGLGFTYPNPLVGSVIVYEGKIIGEGWHQKAGEPHAEVNAINSVKDKNLLSQSTIYVNLEPCSHYGKTPPCADLIVQMNIKNVVIGTIDYNSKVYGKGIEHLKQNGCNVVVGVLEKACRAINKRFFTFHKTKRPYIILKWAETKDGYIFPEERNVNKKPIWISNTYALQLVHKWRTEEQSILVGTNTAIQDNPKLNARNYFGKSPIRIAIDCKLKIPKNYNFFDGDIETIIFTEDEVALKSKNINYVKIDFSKNVTKQVLRVLYNKGVQSLIIEGGTKTLNSFIEEDLWDEARVFESENYFGAGIKSPKFYKNQEKAIKNRLSTRKIKNNKLSIYSNDKKYNI